VFFAHLRGYIHLEILEKYVFRFLHIRKVQGLPCKFQSDFLKIVGDIAKKIQTRSMTLGYVLSSR